MGADGNSIEKPTQTSLCHAMTPSLTDNPFNLSIASINSAGVVLNQDTLLISGGYGNHRNMFMVDCDFLSFYILC